MKYLLVTITQKIMEMLHDEIWCSKIDLSDIFESLNKFNSKCKERKIF